MKRNIIHRCGRHRSVLRYHWVFKTLRLFLLAHPSHTSHTNDGGVWSHKQWERRLALFVLLLLLLLLLPLTLYFAILLRIPPLPGVLRAPRPLAHLPAIPDRTQPTPPPIEPVPPTPPPIPPVPPLPEHILNPVDPDTFPRPSLCNGKSANTAVCLGGTILPERHVVLNTDGTVLEVTSNIGGAGTATTYYQHRGTLRATASIATAETIRRLEDLIPASTWVRPGIVYRHSAIASLVQTTVLPAAHTPQLSLRTNP